MLTMSRKNLSALCLCCCCCCASLCSGAWRLPT